MTLLQREKKLFYCFRYKYIAVSIMAIGMRKPKLSNNRTLPPGQWRTLKRLPKLKNIKAMASNIIVVSFIIRELEIIYRENKWSEPIEAKGKKARKQWTSYVGFCAGRASWLLMHPHCRRWQRTVAVRFPVFVTGVSWPSVCQCHTAKRSGCWLQWGR